MLQTPVLLSWFHFMTSVSPGYVSANAGDAPSLLYLSKLRTQPYLLASFNSQTSATASLVEHLSFQPPPFKRQCANHQMSIVIPDFISCRSCSYSSCCHLPIHPSMYYLSHQFTHQSIHPTTSPSNHPSFHLHMYTHTHSFTHTHIYPFIHQSTLFIHPII